MELLTILITTVLLINFVDCGGPAVNVEDVEDQKYLTVIENIEKGLHILQSNLTTDKESTQKKIAESIELIDLSIKDYQNNSEHVATLQNLRDIFSRLLTTSLSSSAAEPSSTDGGRKKRETPGVCDAWFSRLQKIEQQTDSLNDERVVIEKILREIVDDIKTLRSIEADNSSTISQLALKSQTILENYEYWAKMLAPFVNASEELSPIQEEILSYCMPSSNGTAGRRASIFDPPPTNVSEVS
jgi:chromosome segregation ATPase